MRCRDVQGRLSLFLDNMLEQESSAQVSDHLVFCSDCRREFGRLNVLRDRLKNLGRVEVPDYLKHLVDGRVASERHDTWGVQIREALESGWSRMRTTEGLWYVTRMAGTAVAFVFFFALYVAMSPISLHLPGPPAERGSNADLPQQLADNVLKNLGLVPVGAQRKPISSKDPMINDLYLLNFGQSASRRGADDTFSVVTVVDRRGAAKIQNVLEYPTDSALLLNFSSMLSSARCRPASQNGRSVESHLVLSFSKISVYD